MEPFLRLATIKDCEQVFTWRNAFEVRQNSHNKNLIAWDEHQKWFLAALRKENRYILIAECFEHKPIGLIRFDLIGHTAEVSVYLVPEKIGQGLGASLLRLGENWIKRQHPEIRDIKATILAENRRSIRTFEKAGYKRYSQIYKKEVI